MALIFITKRFLYNSGGSMHNIGDSAYESAALGMNNNGQIVGYVGAYNDSYGGYNPKAFISTGPDTMRIIGGWNTEAFYINDTGQIVSMRTTDDSVYLGNSDNLLQYRLPLPSSSWPSAINNSGQIVGWSSTGSDASGNNQWNSFVIQQNSQGGFTTNYSLGLSAGNTFAYDINSTGNVVGASAISGTSGTMHAFLYETITSTTVDLNSAISPTSGWTLSSAKSINDKGQIVGIGTNPAGQTHAFLLSPVFSVLKQSDTRWASNQYANSPNTIQDKGCALSSLAMVLTGGGIAEDPGSLNLLLTASGGYSKDAGVNWETAVRDVANVAGVPNLRFNWERSSSPAVLDNMLTNGPVIVGVNYSATYNAWTHFIVVTGKQGSTYTIADPDSSATTLAAYGNLFETRGYVTDPTDLSAVEISVVAPGSGVDLLLMDSHGNKTGIDETGGRFELIPNSVHFIDAIAASGLSPSDVSELIDVAGPESGNYGIEVRGIDAGQTSYELYETAFAPDGTQLWHKEISGTVAAGAVDQYLLTYAVPEPGTLALLGVGAFGLLGYARRRTRP